MKQLEVGKTLITQIPLRNDSNSEPVYTDFYYGNIISGKSSRVPDNYYVKLLVLFLSGESENGRGLEYEIPEKITLGDKEYSWLEKDEFEIGNKKIDVTPLKNRLSSNKEEKATVTVSNEAKDPVASDLEKSEEEKPTFAEIREQRKLEKQKKKEEERQEKLRQQQLAEEEKKRKQEEQEKQKAEQEEARRIAEEEKRKAKEEAKAKAEAERLKKQQQKQQEIENDIDGEDELEYTQEIPVASSNAIPKAYTIKMATMVGITVASILVAVFAFLCLYGVIPSMNPALSTTEKKVIHLVSDVQAGEVITKDDVESVMITTEQYNDMSGKNVIKADGTTMNDSVVLYDNISDVVGKYATDNLTAGDYLMASDYSDMAEGDTVITMNVDGTETTIPINVTTAGKSSINLYAIVTTTLEDGTKKNLALNMGTFSLEGRTLEDVLNSDGKSVIGDLLNQSESKQEDTKAEEPKATAEATATPEGE